MLKSASSTHKMDSRYSKRTGPQKKRRLTLKWLSPLMLLPLTHLVASTNNLPPTRAKLLRRTRITSKEVFGTMAAKKVIVATTSLQWMLMPTPSRKKWKMSPKSIVITVTDRDIMTPDVSKMIQTTSVNYGNLYASDWN